MSFFSGGGAGVPRDCAPRTCSVPGGAVRLQAAVALSASKSTARAHFLEAIFGGTDGTQDGGGRAIPREAVRDTFDDRGAVATHERVGGFLVGKRRRYGRFTAGALLGDTSR